MSASKTAATSPEEGDSLINAIDNVERLMNVWELLNTSKASCTAIKALIASEVKVARMSNVFEASKITFEAFDRLASVCESMDELGGDHSILVEISALCQVMVYYETGRYPPFCNGPASRRRDQTELQQLEILEMWVDMKEIVEKSCHDAGAAIGRLEEAIKHGLRELRSCSIDHSEAGALEILRLSARVRNGVSANDVCFIDRVISGKISGLKGSRNALLETFPESEQRAFNVTRALRENDIRVIRYSHESAVSLPALLDLENKVQELKEENEFLKRELRRSPTQALFELEAENALLAKKLEEEVVISATALAYCEDNYNHYQAVIRDHEKNRELLLEIEEDREKLSRENSNLSQELGKTKHALLEADEQIESLSLKRNWYISEKNRLTEELKDGNEALEEIEEENVALRRAVEKFNIEETHFYEELTVAANIFEDLKQENAELKTYEKETYQLGKSLCEANATIEQLMPSMTAAKLEALNAQKYQLEVQLCYANNVLAQMRALLGPDPTYYGPWMACDQAEGNWLHTGEEMADTTSATINEASQDPSEEIPAEEDARKYEHSDNNDEIAKPGRNSLSEGTASGGLDTSESLTTSEQAGSSEVESGDEVSTGSEDASAGSDGSERPSA